MWWSFSEGRMFRQCQRKWFFSKRLANPRAKDPVRHQAYLLGKLQSIHAWRGRVVDQVIQKVVVPAVQRMASVNLDVALRAAENIFGSQLDFALRRGIWEPGFKATEHEDDSAAFFCMEYGQAPTQDEVGKAKAEVRRAISNLFRSPQFQDVREKMKAADQLVAQCSITFHLAGATVRAVPDLVCLFRSAPPLIIDWKVHIFGVHDYYQQLVSYAVALTSCGPHNALPTGLRRYPAHAVRLIEAQLLTDEARPHLIAEEDVMAVQDRMALEIQEMQMAVDGREAKELTAEDFPTASRLGVCDKCNFRRLCWEK